jgi:hypothetical protein
VDDSLVGRKICDSVWAVYASKNYVQQHGRPLSIAELAAHALIGFDGIMQNHRVAQWLPEAVPGARARSAAKVGVPGISIDVSIMGIFTFTNELPHQIWNCISHRSPVG